MSRRTRKQLNLTGPTRVRPCKDLAKGSLHDYHIKGLESTSGKLLNIWLKLGPYPSVYKEVKKAITPPNSISWGGLIRSQIRY